MDRRIGNYLGNEELKKLIIPSYHRISAGDGYLEALVQPIVESVCGGKMHKTDILVCATGLENVFNPLFVSTQTIHYLKTSKETRSEDCNIRYRFRNRFAFPGNSEVKANKTKDVKGLRAYMRDADHEGTVE
nr:4-hydroxyacetophenone monooxygenase [Colletotrichum truncatum]KAF6789947.1 4-hydroxyacetophenone monooxygenase [Colletotrichum truncatum]